MIQPELFSDSHQAFEHFRKVTDARYFLKSQDLLPPNWPWILLLTAWLTTIWIVHFFVPPSVVQVLALPKDRGNFWLTCVAVGTVASVPFLVIYAMFDSRRIIRGLKDKGIVVAGWNWWGPEVQLLMLKEFTAYLAHKGFYNPDALNQLIKNTRDEIEARWRPIPVILTLSTLVVALIIAYYQSVFGQFLQMAVKSNKEIRPFALLGVAVCMLILLFGYMLCSPTAFYVIPIGSRYLSLRSERAIYMHCLAAIRLSLLKAL
jgi:hypothetical protein